MPIIVVAAGLSTLSVARGAGPKAPVGLTVFGARTPPVLAPHVATRGVYPQLSRVGVDLTAVNAAIRSTVLRDERAFAAGIPETERTIPRDPGNYGIYKTSPTLALISASTVVVSALVPTLTLLPAGNDGAWWLSVTVEVATARRVGIADLFVDSSRGLKALAGAARKRLTAANACVSASVADATIGRLFAHGFDPTIGHYKYFALLPGGLAVGFPLGQVSGPPCGRVRVTVPYSVLRPYLSNHATELIAGVRRPNR